MGRERPRPWTLLLLRSGRPAHAHDRFLQSEIAERALDRLALGPGDGTDDGNNRVPGPLERDLGVLGVGRRGRLDGVGAVERSVERDAAHPRSRTLLRVGALVAGFLFPGNRDLERV